MKPIALCLAAAGLATAAGHAASRQPQEGPFWAKGRPKAGAAARMARIPAYPIPTPADKLPVAKMKLPPGFEAEVWASDVLDARALKPATGPGCRGTSRGLFGHD